MIAVTALLRAKKGEGGALERILRELTQQVLGHEPGCLLFRAARSRHDPQLYLVLERYSDDEALAAHANSEHCWDATPALMECLEQRPEIALFDEFEEGA